MSRRDIVVIGASAGGLPALTKLIKGLPADLPASLFVVIHIPPNLPSNLAAILRQAGSLEAVFPRNGETIRHGYIYIAPPNQHMILGRNGIELTLGPRENRARPAIDPLFKSAGKSFGDRVIGIILSGNLDDGTAGFAVIKACGGVLLAQDPHDAEFPSMPASAIENVAVDEILPVDQIGARLLELIRSPVSEETSGWRQEVMQSVPDTPSGSGRETEQGNGTGPGLHFSCPDCGGVMSPVREAGFLFFRCEVGHTASPQTLLTLKNEAIEEGLWATLRTLEEKSRLLHYMAATARTRGIEQVSELHEQHATTTEGHARLIQSIIASLTPSEQTAR